MLGFPLQTFALMLGAGRVYDVVADIAVAYASDNTQSRFGKRKPWIVCGGALYFGALLMLYSPGPGITAASVGFAIFLYFTTWTMAYIPFLTQSTELSSDNQVRNRISMTQAWVTQAAILSGILLPFLLVDARNSGARAFVGGIVAGWHVQAFAGIVGFLERAAAHGGEAFHRNLTMVTWVNCIALPIALIAYILFVPGQTGRSAPPKGSVTAALKNPVFQRFTAGFCLMMCGFMGRVALFPFVIVNGLKLPDSFLLLFLIQQAVATFITPFWATLLRRFERSTCVVFAAVLEALGLVLLMIVPPGDEKLAIAASVIMGLPGQAILLVPMQIAGDCADFARWKTRKESRAVHVSLLTTMVKLGAIASAGLLWLDGRLGFDPTDRSPSDHALWILRFTGLGLPALFLIAGTLIVLRFPLTRRRQEAIRRRIDRRAGQDAAVIAAAVPEDAALRPA
jgi:Na+/melibiose symporter-like transporter